MTAAQQLGFSYEPHAYNPYNELGVTKDIRRHGFDPVKVHDGPGFVYYPHAHPETKLLVFLRGVMDVRVGDRWLHCGLGDRLLIPGNTPHEAKAGPQGCEFFWSEKALG